MVNEENCNTLAITSLLQEHHPAMAAAIIRSCENSNIPVIMITGANDYWCRDFMPVQVSENKFVQFSYDPSYYDGHLYDHLLTDISKLSYAPAGEIIKSNIVVDGGNIIHFNNTAIITDCIFKDNPEYSKPDLIAHLTDLLELQKLVVIPAVPYDITGHADGMVKFINEDTLFVNDFNSICSPSYCNKLARSLKSFKIISIPNEYHRNAKSDDATGDYINIIVIKDLIFLAAYGYPTDHKAFQIIQSAFPHHTIVQVQANDLAAKGGILHCASWNLLA